MPTKIQAAKTMAGPWNAFSDIDVFVARVEEELKMVQSERGSRGRKPPKEPLSGLELRRVIMAIWSVCFCGMQWRAIGVLTGLPFGTIYSCFARWTRFGLWGRLLRRLVKEWRRACGDAEQPTALVVDSRSCSSSPTCGQRGVDGGKKVRGVKVHLAVDKHGFPDEIDISTANVHDSKGIRPVLCTLVRKGFRGTLLGDSAYKGQPLATFAEERGMRMVVAAGGDGTNFIPQGIRWVVERSFAWLSRYRRLNTIFERTGEHLIAFIQIAFASILARRITRISTH